MGRADAAARLAGRAVCLGCVHVESLARAEPQASAGTPPQTPGWLCARMHVVAGRWQAGRARTLCTLPPHTDPRGSALRRDRRDVVAEAVDEPGLGCEREAVPLDRVTEQQHVVLVGVLIRHGPQGGVPKTVGRPTMECMRVYERDPNGGRGKRHNHARSCRTGAQGLHVDFGAAVVCACACCWKAPAGRTPRPLMRTYVPRACTCTSTSCWPQRSPRACRLRRAQATRRCVARGQRCRSG